MVSHGSSYRYLVSALHHDLKSKFAQAIKDYSLDDAIKNVLSAIFVKKEYLRTYTTADESISKFKNKFGVYIAKIKKPQHVLYELAVFLIWDANANFFNVAEFMRIANPKTAQRKKKLELPALKEPAAGFDKKRRLDTQGNLFKTHERGQWD
jgi:hypothetical protein